MIKHIVMVNFKPEVSQEQQVEFGKKVPETLTQIPGTKNVTVGQALDVEGKPRYSAVTLVDFDGEAQLKAYLGHPAHKAIEAQLVTMCSDVMVVDLLY